MNLRQQLKLTAKSFLANAKPSPLAIGIVATALITILNVLDGSVTRVQEVTEILMDAYNDYYATGNFDHLMNTINSVQLNFTQNLLSALISIMILMISTGIIIYIMNEVRYHKGGYGNLFDAMPMLFRVIWYQFLTSIMIALWTLLLIVPGVIASYRYRQGLYILLDHPEMSVMDCIRASKKMMVGNKMELFVFDLSFLGWTVGLAVVERLLNAAFNVPYLTILLLLPMTAFIRMYMEFTQFLYYEHLNGVHYDPRVKDTAQPEV